MPAVSTGHCAVAEDMTSVQVPGGSATYKDRGGREAGNRDSRLDADWCRAAGYYSPQYMAALCPTGPSSKSRGPHRSAAPAPLGSTRAAAGQARSLTPVCLPPNRRRTSVQMTSDGYTSGPLHALSPLTPTPWLEGPGQCWHLSRDVLASLPSVVQGLLLGSKPDKRTGSETGRTELLPPPGRTS